MGSCRNSVTMIFAVLVFLSCHLMGSDASSGNVWNVIENAQHIMKLTTQDVLGAFTSGSTVRVVYYFKKDLPRLRSFIKAYDKSANYLNLYGVHVAAIDCNDNENKELEKCKEDGSEMRVYTYSHGHELLQLELETMFDVNSIMSNILQLLLLREVPILQSKEERVEYENKQKGTKDIFFSYQRAIGTYEHRVFMEVAYAYQDQFRFAVTTNIEAVEGLEFNEVKSENAAVWLLQCKEAKGDKPCGSRRYFDPIDLSSLAKFIKILSLPPTFDIPNDGLEHPYTQDASLSIIYMYYRPTVKDLVTKQVESMRKTLGQIAWFVTINIEEHLVQHKDFNGETPSVSVQNINDVHPVQMQDPWSEDTVFEFVINHLDKAPKKGDKSEPTIQDGEDKSLTKDEVLPEDNEGGDLEEEGEDRVSEVETQDDHVAEAVFRARRIEMDLSLVPALTDKSFPTTVQSKDLLMVLFYLPFDHRSMAFLRAYGEASRKLENDTTRPLASVNCHDWTDVCGKEKITMYPTIRIFKKGSVFKDYDGMLDLNEVVKTVRIMARSNPEELESEDSISKFTKADDEADVKVLGLFEQKQSTEAEEFLRMAANLSDKFLFGVNKDGKGKKMAKSVFDCKLPCMVILKKNDSIQPFTVYKGKFEKEEMGKFVMLAQLPSMPELTARVFPALYRQGKPFVIAFLDQHQESINLRDIISDIVMEQEFPDVIFSWMGCSDHNSFERQILTFYDKDARVPALSYVNLKESKVFNMKAESFTAKLVQKWIEDVKAGKIQSSRSLEKKDWKPKVESYNFLELVDKELQKDTGRVSNTKLVNEQGIGFDKDGNEVSIREMYHKEEEDPVDEDTKLDQETRMELFKSRLYHHAEGRKHGDAHKPSKDSTQNFQKSATQQDQVDFTEHDITGLDEEDFKNKEDIPFVPHEAQEGGGKSPHKKHEEL